VTDGALYRLAAGADGTPRVLWRRPYDNTGATKSGQTQPGSGTTPTLMGDRYVAITDNDDPVKVIVALRDDGGVVCTEPLFEKGASSTDQSLIATDSIIVAENNFGYSSPTATEGGRTTSPGLQRVDVEGGRCRTVWRSREIAPSVVPKLSLAAGLVYTYAKPARDDGQDAWYLTALDVRTGETAFRRLGGEGLGFNNNYAPITLGPDRTAYLGVLGGIVAWRDRQPPPSSGSARAKHPRVALRVRCLRGHRARLTLTGAGVARVTFTRARRATRRDRTRPVHDRGAPRAPRRRPRGAARRPRAARRAPRVPVTPRPFDQVRRGFCDERSNVRVPNKVLGYRSHTNDRPQRLRSRLPRPRAGRPDQPPVRRRVGGLAARGAREAAPGTPRAARDPCRRQRRPAPAPRALSLRSRRRLPRERRPPARARA
jgi:hypothetical protein